MNNINTLLGYANQMHIQAQMLVEKTAMLCISAHNLTRAGAAIDGRAPRAFKITFDIGDNNQLMAQALGTADVITKLHDVFDVLNEKMYKMQTDAEIIAKRMARKRRRDMVIPDEEPDDDVTFIMERRARNN